MPQFFQKGRARTAFFEPDHVPRSYRVVLENNLANKQVVLPANCGIVGPILTFNNGTVNQAAITIGTSAAGTQVQAGAVVNLGTTLRANPTDIAVTRADRTLFIESAAWQVGVSIVFEVAEYPFARNTD